jgi:acyl carrier protein
MTKPFTPSEILEDLSRVLARFQGRVYAGPLGPETRFFGDLGLASIDAVVLGEELQQRYGQALPFGELMADLGGREDRDITMGELAAYVARHLKRSEEGLHAAH